VKNDAHRQFQPGGLAARLAAKMRAASAAPPRLVERATPLQARYIDDRAALLSYLAGRRHGKTDGVAARIITHSKPGTMTAYVAPTITRANEILVPLLRQLRRDCAVGWEQRGDVISFTNGGQLRLMGASNSAEVQKLRGEDLLAVYFDECGVIKDAVLREALFGCAWEALRRYRGEPGSGVSLSGTPGPLPEGLWWEVSTQHTADGKPMYGASRHVGTIHDNPLFAGGKAERTIQEDLDAGIYISREDSRFRREVLAQWCLPSEQRCYPHAPAALIAQGLAPTVGRTIMAVDFGWHDATAIVILRLVPFEEHEPQADGSTRVVSGERAHVLWAEKQAHWELPDIAARVRELTSLFRCGTVVGDSGGNRLIVEAFASQFGIPMLPAQKGGMGAKRARIHTLNDLFAIGQIALYEGAAPLFAELGALVWNEDRSDHDVRQEDHCSDAMGYAILEHFVPTTESRLASAREKEIEAAATRKREALNRPLRLRRG
jgi:hypothetical protein